MPSWAPATPPSRSRPSRAAGPPTATRPSSSTTTATRLPASSTAPTTRSPAAPAAGSRRSTASFPSSGSQDDAGSHGTPPGGPPPCPGGPKSPRGREGAYRPLHHIFTRGPDDEHLPVPQRTRPPAADRGRHRLTGRCHGRGGEAVVPGRLPQAALPDPGNGVLRVVGDRRRQAAVQLPPPRRAAVRLRGAVGAVGERRGAVESCAILTTAANAVVRPVHERMPVILPPENFAAWLDPRGVPAEMQALLRP